MIIVWSNMTIIVFLITREELFTRQAVYFSLKYIENWLVNMYTLEQTRGRPAQAIVNVNTN